MSCTVTVPFLVGLKVKEVKGTQTIVEIEYLAHKDHVGLELLGTGGGLSTTPESSLLMEPTSETIQEMVFYRIQIPIEDELTFLGRSFDAVGESFYEPGEYHVVKRRPNGSIQLIAKKEYINSIDYQPSIPLNWKPNIDEVSKKMLKIRKVDNFPQFCIDVITYLHHWIYHPEVLKLRLDQIIKLLISELRKVDSHSVDQIMRPVAIMAYKILEEIRTFEQQEEGETLTSRLEKGNFRAELKQKLKELKENPIINPMADNPNFSYELDSVERLKALLQYL